MASIDFPSSPVHGSTYTFLGVRYIFIKQDSLGDPYTVGYWSISTAGTYSAASVAEINAGIEGFKYISPLELSTTKYVRENESTGVTTLSHNGSAKAATNSGGFAVTGLLTSSGRATVTGITVNGTSTLSGNTAVTGTLTSTGKATLNSLDITGTSILRGTVTASGAINVSGRTTTSTLTVTGTATMASINSTGNILMTSGSVNTMGIARTGASAATAYLTTSSGYGTLQLRDGTGTVQEIRAVGNNMQYRNNGITGMTIASNGAVTFASTVTGSITGNAGTATYATSAGSANTATSATTAGYATTAGNVRPAAVHTVLYSGAASSGNVSIASINTYDLIILEFSGASSRRGTMTLSRAMIQSTYATQYQLQITGSYYMNFKFNNAASVALLEGNSPMTRVIGIKY